MFVNNLFRVFKVVDIIFINHYNRHIRQWRKDNKKKGKRLYIYKYRKEEERIYLNQKIIFILIPNHQFTTKSPLLLFN